MRRALLALVVIACKSRSPVRDQILAVSPHVMVIKTGAAFVEYRDIIATAKALDPSIEIAAPMAFVDAFASSASAKHEPVLLKGEDETQIAKLLDLPIVSGSLSALRNNDPAPIVLGQGLATKLGVTLGGSLELAIPAEKRPYDVTADTRPTADLVKRFTVVAVFLQPAFDYDLHAAYTTLATVQTMAERGDQVSGVSLRLSDPDRADAIVERLEKELGGAPYAALSWNEVNKDLLEH